MYLLEKTLYPKILGGKIGFSRLEEGWNVPENYEDDYQWVDYEVVGIVIG